MSKENTTMYLILGLLNHEAMSGYDIKKRIDSSINNFWDAGYGQIYPALKMLEEDGSVTKTVKANGKGPERKIYSITAQGKQMLAEWLEMSNEKEYVKFEILLKLFFGSMLSIEDNIKKIKDFRTRMQEKLKLMELFSKSLKKVLPNNKDHYYYYLTVLFGQYAYEAYLNWAAEAVNILESMEDKSLE